MPGPRVALLCSGLGRIARGHEVFARDLFTLLHRDLDITLFKGGGEALPTEVVVPNVGRDSPHLLAMQLPVAPKWRQAAIEMEALRIEGETFAWGALQPLLAGDFDIVHCLEQEVCRRLWSLRHLFRRTPRILWSNGGALPAPDIPPCDAVQEHTDHNLARSVRGKAFMIPHGVDLTRFHPGVPSDFRARHGIPADAFVVISVGSIGFWHKRMDHVIREVAEVPRAWLVIAGQRSADTPAIEALAHERMPGRVVFTTLAHDDLPQAYAAADVFVLGSLFETFGIAYIEAMAMGLPVVSTGHPNQRSIIREGCFIDMARPGMLAATLRDTRPQDWRALGRRGLAVVQAHYDLTVLKQRYLERYAALAAAPAAPLPRHTPARRLVHQSRNLWQAWRRQVHRLSTTGPQQHG